MNCARPLDPIFSVMAKRPRQMPGRPQGPPRALPLVGALGEGFNIDRLARALRFGPQLRRARVHAPRRSD
jgi:hypothetical protein